MERSSRRDRSRDPEDDASSDTGTSTRLRRRMRSMVAESDGADTDASSIVLQTDQPMRRLGRRGRARKVMRKSSRGSEYLHSPRSGDDYDEDDAEDQKEEIVERRQRSLSIVSNTSSTSVSSLTSEPLTEEQRLVRADQQMAELEQKKKMVEDGTLAEFCRRVAAFKEERNRLLQTAELHKNLQLKNGKDLYNFEVQRAYNLWKNDQKELENELLTKVDVVMAKLQVEMKALSEPGAKIGLIKNKSKQKLTQDTTVKPAMYVAASMEKMEESKRSIGLEQEESEVPEIRATSKVVPSLKRRKVDLTSKVDMVEVSEQLPQEMTRLPFDALTADIAAIVSNCKRTAKATADQISSNRKVPFKLERRRLICGKDVFEDGDEVHISLPLIHEDYRGTISSITNDAIYVRLTSDYKVRILLPHIEFRRCELKPALRGSSSSGNLQSLGWSEYDTLY